MRLTGVHEALEIHTIADIPSEGTGLGSSSSLTVGLLNALYAYRGILKDPAELAEEACRIEIDRLRGTLGKQDQYIAAFGGVEHFEFQPDDSVRATPIPLSTQDRVELATTSPCSTRGSPGRPRGSWCSRTRGPTQNEESLVRLRELALDGARRARPPGLARTRRGPGRGVAAQARAHRAGYRTRSIDRQYDRGEGGRCVRRQGHRGRWRRLPPRRPSARKQRSNRERPVADDAAAGSDHARGFADPVRGTVTEFRDRGSSRTSRLRRGDARRPVRRRTSPRGSAGSSRSCSRRRAETARSSSSGTEGAPRRRPTS